MEPDQVQPGPGHQRGQSLHERQRRHHDVDGAVAPGRLQLKHDLPSGVAWHPLVCQRRAGDVAAQLLEAFGLVGGQAETLHVGTQRLGECGVSRHRALRAQQLPPAHGPKAMR